METKHVLSSLSALIVSSLLSVSTAMAQSATFTCSTDSAGKAVILDSSKPGKTFTVAKVKASLTRKKAALKEQQSATKANKNLSKTKKAAKLAAIKAKLDENAAALAVVKSCTGGSNPGGSGVRTQLVVNTIRCFGGNFNDCDFRGFLLPQSQSSLCAQDRTITVSRDGVALNSVVTKTGSLDGNWDASIETNPGPGTYTVDLAEKVTGKVTCLAAKNVYSMDESGAGVLVSESF